MTNTTTTTDPLDLTVYVDGKPYTGTVYDNQPRSHWDTDLEARVQFPWTHYTCNGIDYLVEVTIKHTNYGRNWRPQGDHQLREECWITRRDERPATSAGTRKGWEICRALKEQVQRDFDKVWARAIQARINRCQAEAKRAQRESMKWAEACSKTANAEHQAPTF